MFALMSVGCSCLLLVVCWLLLSIVFYMFVVVFPFDVPRRAWNVGFLKCMICDVVFFDVTCGFDFLLVFLVYGMVLCISSPGIGLPG